MSPTFRISLIIFAIAALCGVGQSQFNVDNRTSVFDPPVKDERPTTIKEQLIKMQIEKDKKDHDAMVARGEEAVKLSTELETSYVQKGALTNDDIEKLARVEKLVKKIRDELGGDDDDERGNTDTTFQSGGKGFIAEAIDSLKSRSSTLLDELKKTTRFSISAAAITTSNALLRITKLLRFRH